MVPFDVVFSRSFAAATSLEGEKKGKSSTSSSLFCHYFIVTVPCILRYKMSTLIFSVFFLLFSSSTLFPVQAQNTWIYPKPYTNPTFSSEDFLEASWTSDYSNPTLLLLCDFAGPPCESSMGEWMTRRRQD